MNKEELRKFNKMSRDELFTYAMQLRLTLEQLKAISEAGEMVYEIEKANNIELREKLKNYENVIRSFRVIKDEEKEQFENDLKKSWNDGGCGRANINFAFSDGWVSGKSFILRKIKKLIK